MLGSADLESILGSGVDNRDHEAVRAFLRQAADVGLSVLFCYPDSKAPADMRTPRQRTADDKAARAEAEKAGRRDWATVKSPAGLALATSDRATLEKYLKRYIQVFSTWAISGDESTFVEWTKKDEDAGTITMIHPAAVNLAVEVGGSGVVVIDCDTPAQMDRWFEAAEVPNDQRPPPTVLSPGHICGGDPDDQSTWAHHGGGHFWFTVPDELIPVLPRHIGAMTWGGDNGFAVLWDRRYVLIPPSTRPEGAYEYGFGHIYELPEWLAEEIVKAGERRIQRAELTGGARTENTDLESAIDAWAQTVSWASILEPMGWIPAPRADACGCAVWTAPGNHASRKSATAHDTGCTSGRYNEVNAPLYVWTDHDVEPFEEWLTSHETRTLSKLQAVAVVSFGGNVGEAMDVLDVTPDLAVHDPDIDSRGVDADLDTSGDGDFSLPEPDDTEVETAELELDKSTTPSFAICGVCDTSEGLFVINPDDGALWHAADEDDAAQTGGHRADGAPGRLPRDPARVATPSDNVRCQCGILVHPDMPNVMPDDAGDLWHLPNGEEDGHPVQGDPAACDYVDPGDGAGPDGYAADLSDLPADFGKADKPKADSPYPDAVDEPDPDVFDSKHTGVPRIAPFSHWRDMPPPEYIIDGLLEHGGLSCVIGPPNIGKSTVMIDMLCHIATGKRWQGRTTLKTRVLYLPGEGLSGAVQRIKAWEAAHDVSLDDDLLLGNGIILVQAKNEAWGEVGAYIARQNIGLVVFDTFARMSAGLEENSATDVGKAVRRFDKLRELTNVGVCVVHHTAKGSPDIGRGSSALNGALDSELLVRPATWDITQIADGSGRITGKPIEVWTSKQKNVEQLDDPIPLLMIDIGTFMDISDRPDNLKAPIITGPNGAIDPMQGDVVLARPLPESVVETAIRIRNLVDRLPEQGATRTDVLLAVKPDAYARHRADAAVYWKQRIGEAVDRALRYQLITTLTGTPSGARYIPNPVVTPDMARAQAAAEITDSD